MSYQGRSPGMALSAWEFTVSLTLNLITNLSYLYVTLCVKNMISCTKTDLKNAWNWPKQCKPCASACADVAYAGSQWPNMIPYRVNDCVVYAPADMVRYHPGWGVPLIFASSLFIKGMIIYFIMRLITNLSFIIPFSH